MIRSASSPWSSPPPRTLRETNIGKFFSLISALVLLLANISSATIPPLNPKPVASFQRFPANLQRLYDGTWEASSQSPFSSVPQPRKPPSVDSDNIDNHSNSNNTNRSSLVNHAARMPHVSLAPAVQQSGAFAFRKRSGFALLSANNHESELGPPTSIVFGELLLRDGAYRSKRDVSLHLVGLYDSSTGALVVVGDILFEDVSSSLQRLYRAFVKASPLPSPSHFNVTEDAFITALTPRFTKYRKKFSALRAGAPTASGVAAQCPFSATFSITPGKYDDQLPSENDHPSVPPFANVPSAASGPAPVVVPGASVFTARAVDDTDEFSSAQDEFVEMKGSFVSIACRTDATLVLSTLDIDQLFRKAINYTLLVTVVAFMQVIVLIRQMEMTSTQAGARRVSLLAVGLQAVADSYLCLGHLTMGIAVQTLFNAFATAAFFKFICFSIFLMRWMLLIWKARRPSGFSEGWEAMRRELSMLYSRFYGSLLLGIFLLYQMQNHFRFFLFTLYSFWVPQIVLNAVEDHRRPLLPVYILGTSITRLAIPLYFWGCPHNFLHIKPQPSSVIALVSWLLVQAFILLSQYKFGPRWFVPKEFLPEKYDYYRPITLDDESSGELEAQENGECRPLVGGEKSEPRRECCICMDSVAIHSRERMVTPCNHFFHAACLERWLEVRMECALCRSPVPPP